MCRSCRDCPSLLKKHREAEKTKWKAEREIEKEAQQAAFQNTPYQHAPPLGWKKLKCKFLHCVLNAAELTLSPIALPSRLFSSLKSLSCIHSCEHDADL